MRLGETPKRELQPVEMVSSPLIRKAGLKGFCGFRRVILAEFNNP